MRGMFAAAALLLMIAPDAGAQTFAEAGKVRFTLDGQERTFVTLRIKEGEAVSSTAMLHPDRNGSQISIMATERADGTGAQVVISLMFTADPSKPVKNSLELISLPTGFEPPYWTSHGAPGSGPVVTFTHFSDKGRAEGEFSGLLCRLDEPEDEVDPNDCKTITGVFETDLIVD